MVVGGSETVPGDKGPCKEQTVEFEEENMFWVAKVWNIL
jgi:hypothetical protein